VIEQLIMAEYMVKEAGDLKMTGKEREMNIMEPQCPLQRHTFNTVTSCY
jgi:hypothetical protein